MLEIPPLRARREDILPILRRQLAGQPAFDADLLEALLLHDYPHNARDLRRVATQLSVRGAGRELWDASLLDSALSAAPPLPTPAPEVAAKEADAARDDGHVPTRDELLALLRAHCGVVANIARETGRSRKQVYRWLVQHQLSLEDYRVE